VVDGSEMISIQTEWSRLIVMHDTIVVAIYILLRRCCKSMKFNWGGGRAEAGFDRDRSQCNDN
jgi:hypothetical protein